MPALCQVKRRFPVRPLLIARQIDNSREVVAAGLRPSPSLLHVRSPGTPDTKATHDCSLMAATLGNKSAAQGLSNSGGSKITTSAKQLQPLRRRHHELRDLQSNPQTRPP